MGIEHIERPIQGLEDQEPSIRGYELQGEIGAGAFGIVYRAFQAVVGREVAIKVIQPGIANQAEFIRRFEAEAQIVARLEHPHIVPLYDYWRDPGGAYLVMRYLRGGNLRKELKQGSLSPEKTSRILDQISGALALAFLLLATADCSHLHPGRDLLLGALLVNR